VAQARGRRRHRQHRGATAGGRARRPCPCRGRDGPAAPAGDGGRAGPAADAEGEVGAGRRVRAPRGPGGRCGDVNVTEEELAELLRDAERAHGEYERELGERDDDWPGWYARYILSRLKADK